MTQLSASRALAVVALLIATWSSLVHVHASEDDHHSGSEICVLCAVVLDDDADLPAETIVPLPAGPGSPGAADGARAVRGHAPLDARARAPPSSR